MENQTSQIVEAGHRAKGNFMKWDTGTSWKKLISRFGSTFENNTETSVCCNEWSVTILGVLLLLRNRI